MTEGPFTDDMIKHALTIVQTQHGIIKYAEAMAQVLAEAGRASKKATGDPPEYAVNKWAEVIRHRALDLLRKERWATTLEQARNKDDIEERPLKAIEHDPD